AWVFEATGKDPAADLRGTYFTDEDAEAVLQAAGGVESLVGAKLMALGFRRVTEPWDGDIGIIRALTGFDTDGLGSKT
ncbi:MAG: hypothetical protein E5V25_32815, partial [Mesorhizobium sp.]